MVTKKSNSPLVLKKEQVFRCGDTKEQLFLVLLGIILFYFVFRLIFFALKVPLYIPPDEVTHFGYCVVFSHVWGFPINTEATYQLGNLTHIPWFYYYVMGKFLSLNILPISDLLYLRFLNIVLTCFTILFSFRWISLVTDKKLTRLFFLILITNIPMFTFLGASVNYDNLVNLCAVMTLYYSHCFYITRSPQFFLKAGITLLIGSLTKVSFLPLVPIFLSILLVHERTRLKSFITFLVNAPGLLSKQEKGLGLGFLILLLMCIHLYGTNLLKFHKIIPAARQVMSEQQLMQQRITARDLVISKYRDGEWTYQQAVEEALKIPHPGDQRTALHVLKSQAENKKNEIPVMSRLTYSYNWLTNILMNSVGICAHRSMLKTANELAIYQLIFFLSFLAIVRYWKISDAGILINQSMVIVLCYSLYLMLFHNYQIYLWSMSPTQGIQGRYIFPVLVPLLGIMTYYLTNYLKKGVVYLLVLLISAFFLWGDFPYFQIHADTAWFKVLEDGSYHQQRGDFYRKKGDLQQAIVEYREAVRLAPDNAWYHRFLGDLYNETGVQDKALEHYLAAISIQPQVAAFYYLAGKSYQDMGIFEKAVDCYQSAIRLEPTNVWYHRFLGDLYRDKKVEEAAIREYEEALKIEPENQYCLHQLKKIKD